MNEQNYEEYWSLTNAFTDYSGDKFLSALKICVDFIDEFKDEIYSPEKYSRLQLKIQETISIDLISSYSLDSRFINSKRLTYLTYHRTEVFEKRYKYA